MFIMPALCFYALAVNYASIICKTLLGTHHIPLNTHYYQIPCMEIVYLDYLIQQERERESLKDASVGYEFQKNVNRECLKEIEGSGKSAKWLTIYLLMGRRI